MGTNETIVIAGGAGFLGRALTEHFTSLGWRVVVLSRHARAELGKVHFLRWDGATRGDWAGEIDGAAALVNLVGRSVNCRYNARNRAEILRSRVDSTRVLGEVVAASAQPPPVWINPSSATIYRDVRDRPMDEFTGEIGDGFSVDVCRKWEQTFFDAPAARTRKVALRLSMVFGPGSGGVFEAFSRIVRLGWGGTLGDGGQFVSWLHVTDFTRAVAWLITQQEFSGAVNLCAPNPLPNGEFMRIFREECGVRIGLPAARWMLEVGAFFLRTETELLLKSRRVVPSRLLAAGFNFEFPEWRRAIAAIISSKS